MKNSQRGWEMDHIKYSIKDMPAAEKSKSIKRDHVRQPEMQPCFPLSSAPTRTGENACGRCVSIEHKRICAVQTQPQPDN